MMIDVPRTLPSGTVTFLFTDVEGSTKLLHVLGAEGYAEALAEHRLVVRTACGAHSGVEVDTQGDAFFVAFPTAPGALAAAAEMTEALSSGPIWVRIGLHTGTPLLTEEGYVGEDVHRAARIAAAGHGGQVLVSSASAALLEPSGSEPQRSLRDLGEHRFKDLSAPERVYQLGDTEFPALKSLYRTNLPVPATPFLGRESELAEVAELLARNDLRLLTLTGPGGTGKTRLALQAAAEASESFPDGITWLPLAPLRDPELLLPSLAQALALKEEPGRPLEDTLAAQLTDKRLLLVLDNLEHLLPQAATQVAVLRDTNATVLVTSRERLRIHGEQTWPVPPLAANDGTALFNARARAVDPSFTPTPAVDELCTRLDELPLAIELAAARTAVFSAQQLLDRLSQRLDLLKGDRDRDPRQETLRATIEWSHDLLDDAEQQLFRRLAVFAGGCTYDGAEQIANADPDTLQSLLDKSLLHKRHTSHEPRYWMLETIRQYAAEQLEASDEAEKLHRRHADYYLSLAEEAQPALREVALQGPRDVLTVIEQDHDNFRSVLDWLKATGETQAVVQLTGALSEFWFANDHWVELRSRLPQALATDQRPTAARARALIGASDLSAMSSDALMADMFAKESLALYRNLGDQRGTADALWRIAATLTQEQHQKSALPLLEESLALFRAVDDQHALVSATRTLAWTYLGLGDRDRALALYEENLHRARSLANPLAEAHSLGGMAGVASDQGRTRAALSLTKQQVVLARALGTLAIAEALQGVARILVSAGRGGSAVQFLSASEALFEEIGIGSSFWARRRNHATETIARERLSDDAFRAAWEEGQTLESHEALARALAELDLNLGSVNGPGYLGGLL